MNRVAVVVLNYKGIEDTVECLKSLSAQTYSEFKMIAVENGSHDGSAETFKQLEREYEGRLTTLYNEKNLGFDGGVNTGIRWALENNYDYVALFNNDAIADKKWLESLISAANKHGSGITTGLLLHRDGKTIDSTGDWYSIWGLPFPRDRNQPASTAPKAGYVFGATGGATLYSIEMLRKIGIFDETFFAYYEDVDISFRAQLAGYKTWYEPAAKAYHKQGGTSSKMPGFTVFQTFKNLPLVYAKNVPRGLLLKIGIRFWPAYFLMLGRAIVHGSGWPAIKGYFQGVWIFWSVALPARQHIQSSKSVEDDYIRSILWPDMPPDQTGLRKLRNIFIKH